MKQMRIMNVVRLISALIAITKRGTVPLTVPQLVEILMIYPDTEIDLDKVIPTLKDDEYAKAIDDVLLSLKIVSEDPKNVRNELAYVMSNALSQDYNNPSSTCYVTMALIGKDVASVYNSIPPIIKDSEGKEIRKKLDLIKENLFTLVKQGVVPNYLAYLSDSIEYYAECDYSNAKKLLKDLLGSTLDFDLMFDEELLEETAEPTQEPIAEEPKKFISPDLLNASDEELMSLLKQIARVINERGNGVCSILTNM